jgi:hypothetical protein
MKRVKLKAMTVHQLVDRFAEIGVAQDQALLYDEIGKLILNFRATRPRSSASVAATL